jgi:hypothetical protein
MTSAEITESRAGGSGGRLQAISRVARPVVLTLLGLGLAAVGVIAVFQTENDTGAAALVTVGVLTVVFAAVSDRLESLRYGDLELVLRRKAKEAAARGDVDEAEALRRAADSLAQRVNKVASSYATVRQTLPSGPERTAEMERITAEAARDAHAADLDPQKVLSLLWTGSEGERIWALGVLLERPELATTRGVLEAVLRPDQMFDQWAALRLAEAFVALPNTRTWARERIAKAVRAQVDTGELGEDEGCHLAAQRVLNLTDRLTR